MKKLEEAIEQLKKSLEYSKTERKMYKVLERWKNYCRKLSDVV
jgi:prefoldin subunit 5